MRPIHLVAVVVLAVAAWMALWLGLGATSAEISAQDARSDSLSTSSAALEANAAGSVAAAQSTREALIFGPTPEEKARAEAERKAREKKVVEGRVVGPDGKGGFAPVANATVWASTSDEDWMKLPLDIETDGLPARWVALKKVQADAQGRFEIEGLKPGPLRMAARAATFAPTYLDHLDLPPYEHHSVGDIKLETGVAVKGRVLDNQGEGLAGVNILIALDCVRRSNLIALPGRGIPGGTTAADGSFVVDQLAYGPWHLLFEAPGFVLAERDGKIERAGQTESGVIVRLEKGVEIRGKVVAKDVELPTGVRIGARLQPRKEEQQPGGPQQEQEQNIPKDDIRARFGMVEADGTFVIPGLKPFSSYRLVASRNNAEGTGWKGFPSIEPQTVQAGSRGVELVYKPESVIVLRAVDDATNAPIEELVVAAGIGRERPLRDDKGEVVHTFPEGKVRYPELRVPQVGGKAVVLRITATGYKDHENKNVPLKPGAELDLGDIRLVHENVVVATVLDETSGQPIEGARVLLSSLKNDQELRDLAESPPEASLLGDVNWKVGRTGADGKARLTSIPGKMVGIVASAKGRRPSKVERVLLPDGADHALELKLGPGGTVIVKVTDASGHPVAGVGVQHRLPRRTADEEDVEGPRKSDAEGIVRFEALIAGVHGFRMHEDQGEVYYWDESESRNDAPRWQEVSVGDGQTYTVEFTAPPRGDVHGIVREGGQPVEGAHLKFVPRKEGEEQQQGMAYWGGQSDPFSTISAVDGAYKLEHLRCGEYTVLVMTARRKMGAEFRVRVAPGDAEHDFDLTITGIEGRVVDEHGAALAGIQIDCWRTNGGLQAEAPYHLVVTDDDRGNPRVDWQQISTGRLVTDENGRYVLTGIVSDEPVVVNVNGEWVEHKSSAPITLSPGETRHGVDFALRLAGQIEVSLPQSAARRQEWYMVSVLKGEAGKEQSVGQTWVGGWNRQSSIPSILPGHYKVVLRRHGSEGQPPLAEAETDVQVGQVSRVTLDPRP
jgi:protocatechuate 3,4-dioxygenase beta subunit